MFKKSYFKTLVTLTSSFGLASPFLFLTSCSSSGIVLANFESYMSPDLMDKLKDEHSNINYLYYSTNEDIQGKFERSYDFAIPSAYMVLEMWDQLATIDYSALDLYSNPFKEDTENEHVQIEYARPYNEYPYTYDGNEYDAPSSDPHNIQCILSEPTDDVIDIIDEYAHNNNIYSDSETILNRAAPYFLQDLMFAYHGDYMDNLPAPDPNDQYISDCSWSDILKIISKEQRFQPGANNNPRNICMIDDARTVYDLSHIAYDEDNGSSNIDVNPANAFEKTPEGITKVYDTLTNHFNPDTFYLNSDSQQVLYPFGEPNKSDENYGTSNGIITYNGDILYAAMGAGITSWEDSWNCAPEYEDGPLVDGNIHIVKPKDTLVCLDMLVMNKKDENNEQKMSEMYDIFKGLVYDGGDVSPEYDEENTNTEDWIGACDEDDNYIYNTTINFDYVSYTPTLWNLNQFVARDVDEPTADNSYFDSIYDPDGDDVDGQNKAELLAEINNINLRNGEAIVGHQENPLDNLTKSNMQFIYGQIKEEI